MGSPESAILEGNAQLAEDVEADRQANPICYFNPRPYAREYHQDGNTVVAAAGGNGSGKTVELLATGISAMCGPEYDTIYCPMPANFPKPPVRVKLLCPDLKRLVEDVYKPLFNQLCPPALVDKSRSRSKDGFNAASSTWYLNNGSYMRAMSYGTPDLSQESSAYDLILFDEPPPEQLYDSQWARISRTGGFIRMAMTLHQRLVPWPISWIDRRIRRKQDGDFISWYQFNARENHRLMDAEVPGRNILKRFEQMASTLPEEERLVRIEGLGSWLIGLVYKEFDEAIHARYDKCKPEDFGQLVKAGKGVVHCGLDKGISHPCACDWFYIAFEPIEALDIDEGDVIQFAEYGRSDRSTGENIGAVQAINASLGVKPQVYHACKAFFERDEKAPRSGITLATDWQKAGLMLIRGCAKEDVRTNEVHKLLRVPLPGEPRKWPRLRLVKGVCRQTVDEYLSWQYKPESSRSPSGVDKYEERDDHHMDCTGYVACGAIGKPAIESLRPEHRDIMTGVPLSLIAPMPDLYRV